MSKIFLIISCSVMITMISRGQEIGSGDTKNIEFPGDSGNNLKQSLTFARIPDLRSRMIWNTPYNPAPGISQTCLSTHIFNDCSTAGYITLGFTPNTNANAPSSDPLTIQQSNLSVGVNNNNPLAKLHIKGAGIDNTSSSFLVNNNANTELFRILDNGYVGIGTSNPQSTLSVNGIITTQKIKVTQTGWADYVFDRTYRLPTLKELQQYIAKNRHLPGIPSEEEVKKEGLDLGNTQVLFLKKMEELTLYLIQQNKELQLLKEQNKRLEIQNFRLNAQQSEIDELKEMIRKLSVHK